MELSIKFTQIHQNLLSCLIWSGFESECENMLCTQQHQANDSIVNNPKGGKSVLRWRTSMT